MAVLFPTPNRKDYIPAIYEPDEDGVMDLLLLYRKRLQFQAR